MRKVLHKIGWLLEGEVGRWEFFVVMLVILSFLTLQFIRLNTALIAIENLLLIPK